MLYRGRILHVTHTATEARRQRRREKAIVVALLAYLLALRLVFLGQIDLIAQEAYYWNYSRHLALSYLDHPPMVAWLIWLGTSVFGHTEFGVRAGAVLSWLVALLFMFLFTRDMLGKPAAFRAALLLAVLPYFFFAGSFMTPDAPLVAFWAGALFFLGRALLLQRRWAWWGVGTCLGLGMLSKYTIALLGPALVLYLLLDRRSRRCLRRPETYGAVLLALLLFVPVILWNYQNDWASFVFQGPRRLGQSVRFGLPGLAVFVLLLITPVGLAAFVLGGLSPGKAGRGRETTGGNWDARSRLFVAVFTLVPLTVFVVFSLWHRTKLDWTGPAWLAALPAMAGTFGRSCRLVGRRAGRILDRVWKPTIAVLVLGYTATCLLVACVIPGVPLPATKYLVDWRDVGRSVGAIEREVVQETGQEPLLVGMNKYQISSQLAFYDGNGEGFQKTAGLELFGENSLMYDYWFPCESARKKTVILVSETRERAAAPGIEKYFERCGPVQTLPGHGKATTNRFCYRIGYGYMPAGVEKKHTLSSPAISSGRDLGFRRTPGFHASAPGAAAALPASSRERTLSISRFVDPPEDPARVPR